jgi:hypothetical protein
MPQPDRRKPGPRPALIAFAGMRFGKAVVTDPDVPVAERPAHRNGGVYRRRCARLRCDCGVVFLAALSHLFSGRTKACPGCAQVRRPRRLGGRVKPSGRGFTVEVYAGYYPSRREAERVARRARVVLIPDPQDREGGHAD